MSVSPDGRMNYCDYEGGCSLMCPHNMWGQIKAHPDWFFGRDGKAFCPDHLPEWVPGWRARKKEQTDKHIEKNLTALIAQYARDDGCTPKEWCERKILSAVRRRFIAGQSGDERSSAAQ
jgi:hypothetical protein